MLFASSKNRREDEQCAKSYREFSVKCQKGDQPMVSWKQNELRERGGKEKKVKKRTLRVYLPRLTLSFHSNKSSLPGKKKEQPLPVSYRLQGK